jgi:hypothetical protein|tara:strand:- start:277 stop:408 length:132 start_codon:yes stop_codon:yes gene_type:complete
MLAAAKVWLDEDFSMRTILMRAEIKSREQEKVTPQPHYVTYGY